VFTKLHKEVSAIGCVDRTWGSYIVLDNVKDRNDIIHRQKLLIVNPNTKMQLHKHINYTELWIGESKFKYVVEDEYGNLDIKSAKPFERVFVPKNRKHQIISNDIELRIFEIQTGLIIDDDNIKFD